MGVRALHQPSLTAPPETDSHYRTLGVTHRLRRPDQARLTDRFPSTGIAGAKHDDLSVNSARWRLPRRPTSRMVVHWTEGTSGMARSARAPMSAGQILTAESRSWRCPRLSLKLMRDNSMVAEDAERPVQVADDKVSVGRGLSKVVRDRGPR